MTLGEKLGKRVPKMIVKGWVGRGLFFLFVVCRGHRSARSI